MRLRSAFCLAIATWCLAQDVGAQFQQYTTPGGFGTRPESRREQLEREMEEAPWRLGTLRIDPWIGLENLSYLDNAFGTARAEQSDLTATVGAGLRVYQPFGSSVTVTGHLLPAYVWWADQSERRRLNSNLGGGFFVHTHRLGLELTADRSEALEVLTSEILQRVNARRDRIEARLSVRLVRSLWLFAEAAESRFRNLIGEPDDPRLGPFDRLDRDETVARGGLTLRIRDRLDVGVGVEDSTADFERRQRDLSNSGTAPFLRLTYLGNRLYLGASLVARSLEPEGPSLFVPYDQPTGSFQVGLNPGENLLLELYGGRNVVFALGQQFSYFEDDRVGLGLRLRPARPLTLRFFAEVGENDYTPLPGVAARRLDTVESAGVDLMVEIGRGAAFQVGVRRTEFDSDLPGFDRAVTALTTGFNIGRFITIR